MLQGGGGLGWQGLNVEPETPDEAEQHFIAKRKIVQAIVLKIDNSKDKSVTVHIDLDLNEALDTPDGVCISEQSTCYLLPDTQLFRIVLML